MNASLETSFLAEKRPIILYLRHAERFPLRDLRNPLDALLTEQGKRDSVEFGKTLVPLAPFKVYHSPVERCRQTAEGIVRGISEAGGHAETAGSAEGLGGPYVRSNFEDLPKMVSKYGMGGFLRKWFDGELPGDILLDLKKSAGLLFGYVTDVLSGIQSNTAMITHDWNIMILREYFLRLSHEKAGFPGFLDGMAIYRNGNGISVWNHGTEYLIG